MNPYWPVYETGALPVKLLRFVYEPVEGFEPPTC